MNLEILWNSEYHWDKTAGNYYQACIRLIRDFVENNPNELVPEQNFIVTNLENGDNCEISFGVVMCIYYMATNYEEFPDEEPALDPNCDLMKEARNF